MQPPSEEQKKTLEKLQINPDGIDNAGKADLLINRLQQRIKNNMASPRQIRQLESRGFQYVGTWTFEQAKNVIDRIAANGWRTPAGIHPQSYIPQEYKGA